MSLESLLEQLSRSFDDRRLSRGERKALAASLWETADDADRAELRQHAFELVRAALAQPADVELLYWLEDVVKTLDRPVPRPEPLDVAEAWFSPSQDCARRIVQLLDQVERTVDICVFTITDDRISGAILAAHRRGVGVRVVTDNEKASDAGSDIDRLRAAGIATRIDRSEFHMHHKFAVFDRSRLLTGSYNWTRGAARDNQENFLVTGDPRLVTAYARAFEALWSRLA